jgi:hypothetical protein
MKHLIRFHQLDQEGPVDMNEGIKDMVGKIFTFDQDETVNKILNEIKYSFDPESVLDIYDGMGSIYYRIKSGETLLVRDDMFFAIPGYTVEVDGKKIECSFLSARKLYNHIKDYVQKIKRLKEGPAGLLLDMGIMKRLPDSLNTSQKIDQVIDMTSGKGRLDKRIIDLVKDQMTKHNQTPTKLMSWIRSKFPQEYEKEFGKEDMAADMGDLGF